MTKEEKCECKGKFSGKDGKDQDHIIVCDNCKKEWCGQCDREITDDGFDYCEYCCPEHELTLTEWTNPKSIHSSSDDLTFGCENCNAIWFGGYNPC